MPRAVDPEERRAELARAAARVIARDGIVGASLREVAAEAGLTTGALTHHFSDKRELLRFTLRASLEHRRRTGPVPDDAFDALRAALEAALPLSEEARLHWIVTVAFCAQAAGDPDLAAEQRDAYRRYRRAVAGLIGKAVAAGRIGASCQPEPTAERLIAVADGVALQALFDPESWPPARQVAVLDAALDGLRP